MELFSLSLNKYINTLTDKYEKLLLHLQPMKKQFAYQNKERISPTADLIYGFLCRVDT